MEATKHTPTKGPGRYLARRVASGTRNRQSHRYRRQSYGCLTGLRKLDYHVINKTRKKHLLAI